MDDELNTEALLLQALFDIRRDVHRIAEAVTDDDEEEDDT